MTTRGARANSVAERSPLSSSFGPLPMARSQSLATSTPLMTSMSGTGSGSSSRSFAPTHHRQRSSLSNQDTMTDAAAQLRQNTSHYYA